MDNKMIEDQLSLEYCGAPVANGRMNSYDVAGYILAFSDFVGVASRTAYGEKITLKTEIQGFKQDSFDIVFALQIAGVAYTILMPTTAFSMKDFIGLVKDSIQAWLHLGGDSPKQISPSPDKQNIFQIENQSGQLTYVTTDVLNIIIDPKAGKSVEQFIKKPLESGLSSVRINSRSFNEVVDIKEKDALCFVPVNVEKPLLENEMKMGLLIEAATFKEGNKWRFFDGQNSFYADIVDEKFLEKVDSGNERFGKGDRLIARIKFVQSSGMGSLKMERTIVEVLEHEVAVKPDRLF